MKLPAPSDRYSRQSFLGADSEERFARCKVAIVGLGGGGSHIVQQLAHIGFKNFVLYDDDVTEESNLNRLIGAKVIDKKNATAKLKIARKMIKGLQPDAAIDGRSSRWQADPIPLRSCHVIFGCVDTFAGRDELEICARRYLVNYIDIGMDVHIGNDGQPVMGGQVILSAPGGPCMRCMEFLTDELLGLEAAKYGDTGGRPQVVWPNGVLASTAVGLAVDLVTNWTHIEPSHVYLEYDGNKGTLKPHRNSRFLGQQQCPHFPPDQVGEPIFKEL